MVSTLLYADDIVFIAPNPESLQIMFDTVDAWSRKWRFTVNHEKTKVIHIRLVMKSCVLSQSKSKVYDFRSRHKPKNIL